MAKTASCPKTAHKEKKKRLHAWPFFARTSHSSKATAALATVASEVALEEALARVERDDGAPSAVEAAASEAAAMCDLLQTDGSDPCHQ